MEPKTDVKEESAQPPQKSAYYAVQGKKRKTVDVIMGAVLAILSGWVGGALASSISEYSYASLVALIAPFIMMAFVAWISYQYQRTYIVIGLVAVIILPLLILGSCFSVMSVMMM